MPPSHRVIRTFLRNSPALFAAAVMLSGCTTTLNKAVSRDDPKKVDRFIESGEDVNQVDKSGATPLINAAQNGNAALMAKLVEHGAKVNETDHDGYSALMYLAAGDTYKNDAVSYLLLHGARTDLWSFEGETVLMIAAKKEYAATDAGAQAKLIEILVAGGASTTEGNRSGDQPLHLAAFSGQPDEAVETLVKATPEAARLNRLGYSALSEAALGDRRGTEEFLVRLGQQPQDLRGLPTSDIKWPPQIDATYPINARSREVYGDFLLTKGRVDEAHENYVASAAAYASAVAEYQLGLDRYKNALKEQKDARTRRIMTGVLLNTVGVGLAGATGVGFFFVPKKVHNDIDEYSDKVDEFQKELESLVSEKTSLQAKLGGPKVALASH